MSSGNNMSSSATRAVSYTSLSWNPSPISSVEELSEKGRKVRERFEDLFLQCVDRQSICRGKLISIFEIFGSTSTRSLLRPNAQSIRKLRRMMRADDCAMNNYLAWSRREIMNALIQRQILIPGIESMSRTHCRIALEEADDRRSFHLMQLPKEVRLMVYEAALSAEDDFVVRGSSKPALLSVSKQVQQEASEIFFRVNRFEFRIDHGYVSPSRLGPRTQLCSVELQWLVNIGPENVANIRHLSFAHYDKLKTNIWSAPLRRARIAWVQSFSLDRSSLSSPVYELALWQDTDEPIDVVKESKIWPALSGVSRQVRQESTEVLLRTNRFRLHTVNNARYHVSLSSLGLRSDKWDSHLDYGTNQFLQKIGTEGVTKLRRLSFAFGSREVQINLACLDASQWVEKARSSCERLPWRTLGEDLKFWQSKKQKYVGISMFDITDTRRLELCLYAIEETQKKIKAAQLAMNGFAELCGTSKRVKTTIEGLEILATAVLALFFPKDILGRY
ncbi:hypothetical protein D6D29_05494 [Aureobasidium pullulans]|nr:hypothetical protein D6D29_05494 [Aureobasidium pullulans]